MFYSVFTHLQYITSSATRFGFLQNNLQAVVNYREVHKCFGFFFTKPKHVAKGLMY